LQRIRGILRLVKAHSITKKTHSSLNTCQDGVQAGQAVPGIIRGYRALGYNYRQNGTILDLISYDPCRGIEITF
jgi:hypothetical protein